MTASLAAHAELTHCPNCANALVPPPAEFCAYCGQESHLRPPTMKEFAQEFGEHFVSTEGSIWRTLRLLLTRPGQLTKEYWAGRRKHYVLPLRLYLTVSVLVLIAFKLMGTTQLDVATESRIANTLTQGKTFTLMGLSDLGLGSMASTHGKFECENLPQIVCQRVQKHMDGDPATVAHWVVGVFDRAADHTGQAMFFLLPLLALWLKFLYRNQHRFYTEHLVFALHLHAFLFVMLLLAAIPVTGSKIAAAMGAAAYFIASLQTVFGGSLWKNIGRALVVAAIHGIAISIALYIMLIWAFAA